MIHAFTAIMGSSVWCGCADRNKVSLTMLRLLQVHFPPIAHGMMYAVDALTMREPVKDTRAARESADPAVSGALTSSLTGAITKLVDKTNPCGSASLHRSSSVGIASLEEMSFLRT